MEVKNEVHFRAFYRYILCKMEKINITTVFLIASLQYMRERTSCEVQPLTRTSCTKL